MALESNHTCSILLTRHPTSAKALFLQSLMKLRILTCWLCNATKSGAVDYIFERKPKYLLLDEPDKLSRRDQAFLLNLMETGLVSETKYDKTRGMKIRTSIIACSSNAEKIIAPLQSGFFTVR